VAVKLSIYVPKDLEEPLTAEAAKRGESPSMFVQSLIRARLERGGRAFSDRFAALAGSWEDSRSADEIVRDIEESRQNARRPALR
jgi:hypothetical protein